MGKKVRTLIVGLIGLFILIQLIPYGRAHENPPVLQEPEWDSPETRAMVKDACFACHSNETEWPWYSNVAPTSWLLQNHIEEGRTHLNFSEWGLKDRHENIKDLREAVESGDMPFPMFMMMHSEARLSELERAQLVEGLITTAEISGAPADDGEDNDDGHEHSHD